MIVITGATGNTGKPAAEALLAKGEKVRVIGRDASNSSHSCRRAPRPSSATSKTPRPCPKHSRARRPHICVIPQDTAVEDLRALSGERVTDAYAAAVANARVPYVVTLSSIGAQHCRKNRPHRRPAQSGNKNSIAFKGLNVLHLRAA